MRIVFVVVLWLAGIFGDFCCGSLACWDIWGFVGLATCWNVLYFPISKGYRGVCGYSGLLTRQDKRLSE
jgi:hypothetical protein